MAASHRVDYSSHAFWCFALSVVLLPIGLGGDRPIPIGFAQFGLSLSCMFLAVNPDAWKKIYFPMRLRVAAGLLTVVIAWAIIQTQSFVPAGWAHPLWQSAAYALKLPVHNSISIVPQESLSGLSRLVTYITAGFLGYVLAQDVKRARQLVAAIWVAGSVICIYGLIIKMTGNGSILWFRKWAYTDDLTATFVNRNHFAIYAGVVLACAVALFGQSWREDVQRRKKHQRLLAWRDWIVKQALPRIFMFAIILVCILFSNSRAGLALAFIGLGAYIFFYQVYLQAWWRAALIGVLAAVVLGAAFIALASYSYRFGELFNDYSSMSRLQVYELAWRAIQDNPWLGYGLNGFEPEYRLYHQTMINEFLHVHNDVLEALLDLGVPVGLMMWTAVGLMLSGLVHGILSRRQNGMYPALALAASIMVLGHALVDFDLQIPGVAITWAALLGVGLAQSWNTAEKETLAS